MSESRDQQVASVRAAYDAVASDYHQRFVDELDSKPLDRALLLSLAELAADGTIVDMGCGPGHVAAFLSQRHPDVRGVDLSPAMIEQARATWPHIRFDVADLRRVPLDAGSCAGIVAFYSIIHLGEDRLGEAFREFRRVLRPGGWLLVAFHVHDAEHRAGDTNHLTCWFGREVELDGHFFDPPAVVEAMRNADLHVTAQMTRHAEVGIEYASHRAYLLARAGQAP